MSFDADFEIRDSRFRSTWSFLSGVASWCCDKLMTKISCLSFFPSTHMHKREAWR